MEQTPQPLLSGPARHGLAIFTFLSCGWLGLYGGDWLGIAIAEWAGRDVADQRIMLLWSALAGGLVSGVAGVWLVLAATQCSREAQRIGLIATGLAVLAGVAVVLASFDWAKSSGTPEVSYEIRLPAGAPQPRLDRVNVMLWSDKAGQICYVSGLRRDGDRPVIAGRFAVGTGDQTLSLGLDREPQGYWTMPVRADAKLDKTFGPWERIRFTPIPRENGSPLPQGEYEVRYRVRKYL